MTTIRFDRCRESNGAAFDNTQVQLTRRTPWFQPDENRGIRTFYCFNTDTRQWADNPLAHDYRFAIHRINSGCCPSWMSLDVDWLRVRWG